MILDEIYKHFMKRLQDDGRVTSSALADEVGITKAAASYRMNSLVDKCIKCVVALPYPKAFGWHIETMCMISLNEQTDAAFDLFSDYLSEKKEIRECRLLTGSVDFYVRFLTKDNYHLEDMMEYIRKAPHINRIQYYNVLENKIDRNGIPL